jgi:hypothetical protein
MRFAQATAIQTNIFPLVSAFRRTLRGSESIFDPAVIIAMRICGEPLARLMKTTFVERNSGEFPAVGTNGLLAESDVL